MNIIFIVLVIKKLQIMSEESMFTILEKGDRKIKGIKKKIIALVGLTRSGKSATFNLMLGKEMIGQKDKIEDFYINNTNDQTAAQLGNSYSSVTLIPNSADLDSETSLVDMAGYCDSRDYVGVMGVSYFLTSIIKHAEEVKFLIVFNEYVFFDETLQSMISIFQNFFNMFKLCKLTTAIQAKLLSSISFVVTRSQNPQYHLDYLTNMFQSLSRSTSIKQNKEIMIKMIEQIIKSKRIYAFKAANCGQIPEKCHLLDQFQNRNWQFINIKNIETQIKESFINNPFEKDYNNLSVLQRIRLKDAIQQRINNYTDFVNILLQLVKSIKLNWNEQIDTFMLNNQPGNLDEKIFCFDNVFEQISNFIQKSDKYNSKDLIQHIQHIKNDKYPAPSLLQAIKQILHIYQLGQQISIHGQKCQTQSFREAMERYSQLYSQMCDCFTPFCRSVQQKKSLSQLKFIMARGFHQFSIFYDIDPTKISSFKHFLKEFCSSSLISQEGNRQIQNFLNIQPKILSYFFRTVQQIQEYEQIFQQYKVNSVDSFCIRDKQFEINNRSIEISMIKSDIYYQQKRLVQACQILIKAFRSLCQDDLDIQTNKKSLEFNWQSNYFQGEFNYQQYQKYFNIRYLLKLKIIQKLAHNLAALNCQMYPNVKDMAINLCKQVYEIQNVCQIYQLQLLDYPTNNPKRRSIYKNYANYCIECGRYSEAKILLQKKLKLEKDNFEDRIQTISELKNLVSNFRRLRFDQQQFFLKLQGKLSKQDDEFIGNLLNQISEYISKDIEISDSIHEKQPSKSQQKVLLKDYQKRYLQQYYDKKRIDKIQEIKIDLVLPDYEDFFNSSDDEIKNQLSKQLLNLQEYKNSLLSSKVEALSKWQFKWKFVEPFTNLLDRTAKKKRKKDIQLLYMQLNHEDKIRVADYEVRVLQEFKQLSEITQILETGIVKIWRQRYL